MPLSPTARLLIYGLRATPISVPISKRSRFRTHADHPRLASDRVLLLRGLLAVQFILAASALYEITEWLVASTVDPVLGVELIGAQGDPWDAAEDMAAALAGSVVVVLPAVWAQSRIMKTAPKP